MPTCHQADADHLRENRDEARQAPAGQGTSFGQDGVRGEIQGKEDGDRRNDHAPGIPAKGLAGPEPPQRQVDPGQEEEREDDPAAVVVPAQEDADQQHQDGPDMDVRLDDARHHARAQHHQGGRHHQATGQEQGDCVSQGRHAGRCLHQRSGAGARTVARCLD